MDLGYKSYHLFICICLFICVYVYSDMIHTYTLIMIIHQSLITLLFAIIHNTYICINHDFPSVIDNSALFPGT